MGKSVAVDLELFIFPVKREADEVKDGVFDQMRFEIEIVLPFADEFGEALGAEGAPRCDEEDRFEEVGFSLRVAAPNGVEFGAEERFGLFVVPEDL